MNVVFRQEKKQKANPTVGPRSFNNGEQFNQSQLFFRSVKLEHLQSGNLDHLVGSANTESSPIYPSFLNDRHFFHPVS